MFGYTMPIESQLADDDRQIFRNYYCETCRQLRQNYGYSSSMTLSYEATFANIFLSSYLSEGTEIRAEDRKKHCIFGKTVSQKDYLKEVTAYFVLMAKNSFLDDKLDGDTLKGNLGLMALSRPITKAEKAYPEYDRIILDDYYKLVDLEKSGEKDPVKLGIASSQSLVDVLKLINTEKYNDDFETLFRNLGVWVYVLDAVEDMDKDLMEDNFNPFVTGNKDYKNQREYIQSHVFEIGEMIGNVTRNIQTSYMNLRGDLHANVNILDNIILKGVPYSSQRIIRGDRTMSLSLINMLQGRMNRAMPPSMV